MPQHVRVKAIHININRKLLNLLLIYTHDIMLNINFYLLYACRHNHGKLIYSSASIYTLRPPYNIITCTRQLPGNSLPTIILVVGNELPGHEVIHCRRASF